MPKELRKYQSMRDFGATPEPKGRPAPPRRRRPIFVVQKHRASHLHYDFRLEIDGVLKSWAVPRGPSYDPATRRLAMQTEDHPYEYASFEGVIPPGNYGAGNVIIWDQGSWELLGPTDDPARALEGGHLKFRLDGKKLKGEWALIRMKGRGTKGNEWLLVKDRDAWASSEVDVTELAPQSVVSGKTVEEVAGGDVWISDRRTAPARTVADRIRGGKKETKPIGEEGSSKTRGTKRVPAAAARKK
ncbi:MAG TPA: DNA polymerase ligase N-terminal domain-containing protein [Thermoanaerobaculia bacterium]|nr:DNA polymerase ligase N-terminal domain-containing protein [Thermoanaerobaculia bacterium]